MNERDLPKSFGKPKRKARKPTTTRYGLHRVVAVADAHVRYEAALAVVRALDAFVAVTPDDKHGAQKLARIVRDDWAEIAETLKSLCEVKS